VNAFGIEHCVQSVSAHRSGQSLITAVLLLLQAFCYRLVLAQVGHDARQETREIRAAAMPAEQRILIIDDDREIALAAKLVLRRQSARIETLQHPDQLREWLPGQQPTVVLLDLNFSPGRTDGTEGLAALARLRSLPAPPSVVVMTAYADVPLAVKALKLGAADFVTKPWDDAKLNMAVSVALAQANPESLVNLPGSQMLGISRAMRSLRALLANVAPTEACVLILGENGVGKELVARAIHQASARAEQTFLAVDMGALPETTFESELFGHCKGAFTDARQSRLGRFQAARGGTLFLDEIGNMPLAMQAKLLTAVERREVTPLGADRAEPVNVRIVSATNVAEARLYDPQVFRPDLLFRLNTIIVRVPPLRERAEDIPVLLDHYLLHYAKQYGRRAFELAAQARETLTAYAWPGNVRSLQHACERAVILAQGPEYLLEDFGIYEPVPSRAIATTQPAVVEAPGTLDLDTQEREAIAIALDRSNGNISHAAKLLGISRAALYRRRQKHGL
jgi:DNA-binding NtrC family response regulator